MPDIRIPVFVHFIVAHRVPSDALVHGVSCSRLESGDSVNSVDAGILAGLDKESVAVNARTLCGVDRNEFTPLREPINCLACLAKQDG